MTWGWKPRKRKNVIQVRRPPSDLDVDLMHRRSQEVIGTYVVPPKWVDEIRTVSADYAIQRIAGILASTTDHVDAVIENGENKGPVDVPIDAAEKLVRIAVVLGCLKPPLAGKMFDAYSDGVLFEAYNRIIISYFHNRHPAERF